MKIVVDKDELINALELIGKISFKHETLPILQCVLISSDKNGVKLQATNLEIGMEVIVAGKIDDNGTVAVPAQTLLKTVQYTLDKDISLYLDNGVLHLETRSTKTSINTFPTEDFPRLTKLTGESVRLNGKGFVSGVKNVSFAASVTSIKPELGSVYIQQKHEHTLTMVSTDSFRLMEKTVSQENMQIKTPFMLPYRNALELARVCEKIGENPEMIITEEQCALSFSAGVYIYSRLVVGDFPDYEQIIPKEFVCRVKVLKSDLLRALKKTNIFLNQFKQVTFKVTKEGLTIRAQSDEIGSITDFVKAESEGGEVVLNFNHLYLSEGLGYFSDDTLMLSFAGLGRALVITGNSDKNTRYLVMPMNR